MEYKDYYKVLGVPRTAAAKEIKAAFRRLARKYHPDVNHEPGAEARFKEIAEAHEVLGDPDKRRQYDELGANWKQYQAVNGGAGRGGAGGFPPGFHPFAGSGPGSGNVRFEVHHFGAGSQPFEQVFGGGRHFSDFFETFFGGGGRTATPAPSSDLEVVAEITLEEAYAGTRRVVSLGQANNDSPRRVEVTVPRGIEDGTRLRVKGAGSGAGQGPGDLYVRVQVAPHLRLRRQGADLLTEVKISPGLAAEGGATRVQTLTGAVELTIAPGTESGAQLRLRGQGMPTGKAESRGDLLVTIRVSA